MGRLLNRLALSTYTAALIMQQINGQVNGENPNSCKGEDSFWDTSEDGCRTCTRCGIGTMSTAENCGFGQGSQGECKECEAEHYQDESHTKDACKRCVQCEPEFGLELRPCTAEQDRLCGCKPGFGVNPLLENTCLKCDLWPDDNPLQGCSSTPTPTPKMPPDNYTTGNALISAGIGYNAGSDGRLADAAIITISIIGAVALMFFVIVAAACVVYHFCGLKEKRKQPPVKMNNAGDAGNNNQQSRQTHNGSHHTSNGIAITTSTPNPSIHIVLPEEGVPLMAPNKNDTASTNPGDETFNSSGASGGLAPLLLLRNMEKWTPRGTPRATPQGTPRGTPKASPRATPAGTPKGTPRGSPCVFRRSFSEPCGDTSANSDDRFSPRDSIVLEESADSQTLALPDKARHGAIQCQEQMRIQKITEDKQKARSIGANNPLHDFVQDFNATRELSRMLEINQVGVKKDWQDLAARWGYSNSDINAMKEITKRGERMGLDLLFEKENAEHYGLKNLEHLLDDLEKIKREDAVWFLSQYLIKRTNETTL